MEQRCEIILQNYLKTHDYIHNTDYKIVENENKCFTILYKNNYLFYIFNNKYYIKYNMIQKGRNRYYEHKLYVLYYNNKNNAKYNYYNNENISYWIYNNNNNEFKYYNKFFKIFKKTNSNYNYRNMIIYKHYYSNSYIFFYKKN